MTKSIRLFRLSTSVMVIKVGINGFGRIGRIIFRTCFQNPEIELSAINDPAIDIDYICYLIKFDSTHGKFKKTVTYTDKEIVIDDHKIKIFREKLPPDVPWHTAGVQYVVESSGMFTCLSKASGHLHSEGVRRVIVTAPSVDVPMIILGVNENELHTEQKVLSCTSSTLYCLAPMIKVLNDHYGVAEGFITSIHAMTPSLKPLDGLCLRGKHWKDHRSIHQNIIPASTGACKALGKIIPQTKDKLTGLAFRVPIVNVSVLDITIRLIENTSIQDIVKVVRKASRTHLQNIIKITHEDAVSSDFIGDSHSCILDVESCLQLRPNFFKIICWYENEYSYACRVVDSIFFSEKQFSQAMLYAPKMTYVRTKTVKKQDVIQQTDCSNKDISIECINNNEPYKIFRTNSNEGIHKSNLGQKLRPIMLRKPLTTHNSGILPLTTAGRDAKKRNDVFKIYNEDCEQGKNSIRQNRGSLFHSCMAFGSKAAENKECMRAQEHLENVKKEFSKMLNITEDLLKKSCSSKFRMPNSDKNFKLTEVGTNAGLNLPSLDNSTQHSINKSKINMGQMLNECGDFKKTVSEISNISQGTKSSNPFQEKETIVAYNLNVDMKKVEKEPTCFNERRNVQSIVKVTSNSETCTINLNSTTASSLVNMTPTTKSEFSNFNTEVQSSFMSERFKTKTSDVYTNSNLLPYTDSIITSRAEVDDDENINTNITEGNLKLDTPREKHACETQTSQFKLPVSEKYTVKDLEKYLQSKNYNMHVVDEELKKRNIILLNDESLGPSKQNEKATEKKFSRKNVDLVTNVLTGLNKVSTKLDEELKIDDSEGQGSPRIPATTTSSQEKKTQDLYDKLDSASATDSNNSFEINVRKSQVIHITDLTNSLEDLSRLDKICRIIEISDELSDKLFSNLNNKDVKAHDKKWSFRDLCERMKLDDFCNQVFGKTSA